MSTPGGVIRMSLAIGILTAVPFLLSCTQIDLPDPPDTVLEERPGSDLAVTDIFANCICSEVHSLNAILADKIQVEVFNAGPSFTPVGGVVTVTFRDVITDTIRIESASFASLDRHETRSIEVFSSLVLIDAASNIRAEVVPTSPVDPNLENNIRVKEGIGNCFRIEG